jgi:hypothetical protein
MRSGAAYKFWMLGKYLRNLRLDHIIVFIITIIFFLIFFNDNILVVLVTLISINSYNHHQHHVKINVNYSLTFS